MPTHGLFDGGVVGIGVLYFLLWFLQRVIVDDQGKALSLVGMLGAAPAMLPTAISTVDTETWDLQDGGTDTWEDDVTIDYQFLANGLLNWERWNNRTYYRFGYEEYTPSDETRAARAVAGKADGKKFRVRDLFFGKRARK